jgi:tRNA A37 N6-isopentenylltransferase MiaA
MSALQALYPHRKLDIRTASSISEPQARCPHCKLDIRTASSISASQARYPHRKLDIRTADLHQENRKMLGMGIGMEADTARNGFGRIDG